MPQSLKTAEREGRVESRNLYEVQIPPVRVPRYFSRKVPFMRCLGAILLVIFAPVILICMLLVRLTSPGPALFKQTRLGKDGRRFEVLKIRTMYCDAEDISGPMLCMPGDSRITPVGRVLRFLHLDELPQLLNVVRGDMCLVGPRPERPEIIAKNKLNERVPGFSSRTMVLPGVTGLAQINLPADQTTECVIPKVKLDLEYIQTASFSLDARILLCTAMRMVGVRHGHAVRLLGLGRKVHLEPVASLQQTNGSEAGDRPAVQIIRPSIVPGRIFAHAAVKNDDAEIPVYGPAWEDAEGDHDEAAVARAIDHASLPRQPR